MCVCVCVLYKPLSNPVFLLIGACNELDTIKETLRIFNDTRRVLKLSFNSSSLVLNFFLINYF